MLLARFGFRELAINRIKIIAVTVNRASQRVAGQVGTGTEGIQRSRLVILDII